MLDIVIPIHPRNLKIAEVCVEAIDKHTPGVPYEIILAIDGATKSDYEALEVLMRARKPRREPNPAGVPSAHQLQSTPPPAAPNWRIVEWPGVVYYQDAVTRGIGACRSSPTEGWVAIIPPWIELRDPRWFAKMQQPYTVDYHTMIVAVGAPGMPPANLEPSPFRRRRHPGTEMILTRRASTRDILPHMKEVGKAAEWVNEFSRVAEERGGNRWLAPSVRYQVIDHHEHVCQSQQEKSETPDESSASPSPMTPSSPSPTTTVADGFGASAPF